MPAYNCWLQTWWEKARRIRQWVAAGPACVDDLDGRLEELLRFLLRQRREWWRRRLASVLVPPIASPADVRHRIEQRLFIFGAGPGRRNYPQRSTREQRLQQFQEAFGPILAGLTGPKTKDESTRETQGCKQDKVEGQADKAKQTQVV